MSERLSRPEVREGAFLILYQLLFGTTLEEIDELNAEAFDMAKNEQTEEIVRGVLGHDEELRGIIAKYSTSRSVSRIAKVNMIILKIAVYEMKYCERVPNAAAINEAVELAKKYSLKADSGFINGILNSYMRELDGKE
ncbi:MAG: transcription antitermination factor NusB [Lachnospiraceae bacterium]|nr:transcription antitermination factor NusB [Ruminococcus sp.]MCM1273914.1 transcription antitermination factor NusB [Lachnospiraceae bacterium]